MRKNKADNREFLYLPSEQVLFSPKEVYVHDHVTEILPPCLVREVLARHFAGDWGDVTDTEKLANHAALQCGGSLFFRYTFPGDRTVWIVTAPERDKTVAILPEDYRDLAS